MNKARKRFAESEYVTLREDSAGICLHCSGINYGVEPDAENYTCDCCEKNKVFGIEQALLLGYISITSGV